MLFSYICAWNDVAVRADVLDLVNARWNGAMVSVAGGARRRAQVSAHCHRLVVDAGVVLGKLIRGNPVLLHVSHIRVAARAGLRDVDGIHSGSGIAGRPDVVNAVTIGADRNLGVARGQALAVYAGVVLVQLIGAQAGIVTAACIAGLEWQDPHSCGICLRSILPFHPALRLIAWSGS